MAKTLKSMVSLGGDDEPQAPQPKKEVKEKEKKPMVEVAAPEFEVSRLHNGQLEFLSIVQCILNPDLQGRLWPRYSADHFAADISSAIYKRLNTLAGTGHDWPKLTTLAVDPALPPAAQAALNSIVTRINKTGTLPEEVTLATGNKVRLQAASDYEGYVFDLLESYRITRQAAEVFVESVSTLANESEFDPLKGPGIVEEAATKVLALRGRESISDALLHFGFDTTEDHRRIRDAEIRKLIAVDKPRFKTGFAAYDEKSGGIQPGEVVLLGANTGGGKTAFQLSLMKNMALAGTSVAMLQLELTKGQVIERLAANLGRIDSEKVRTGTLTAKDHAKIQQSMDEFDDDCKAAKSRFTVFAPSSATIQECEYVFKSFPYSVWFIDYINLLNWTGVGKDQDWLKLSEIVKEFKRLAKRYSIAIVLAVQVNIDKETGEIEIRYSRAMKEHADVVIVWNKTQEADEEGVVWLHHLKARQYEPFDFPVRLALHYCSFESYSPGDQPTIEDRKLGKKRNKLADNRPTHEKEGPATFAKKEKPLVEDDMAPLPPRKPGIIVEVDDHYHHLDNE